MYSVKGYFAIGCKINMHLPETALD